MAFLWDLTAEFVDDARALWSEAPDEDDDDAADEDASLVSLSERSTGGWVSARGVPGGDSMQADLRHAERTLHARGEGLARLDATVNVHASEAARMRSRAAELRTWSEAHPRRGCLACF